MLLPALLVVFCVGSIEGDRSNPAQYRYNPYKGHLDYKYYKHYQHLHQQNNRRHASYLSSPAYRYQPRPVRPGRHLRQLQYKYDRKPILIKPSQPSQPRRQKVLRRPLPVPANNERRTTRKIEQTPLRKEEGGRGKYSPLQGKKYQNNFLIKNDNLAVESQILETKVKVPAADRQHFSTSARKVKPHSVKSSQNSVKPAVAPVPVNRNYNNVPQRPKFIIKQAGPSQQFGWVGHGGHQAPVNIPNIFRAAGLSTRWTPGLDPLFQVGLLYPASPATGQAAPVAPPPPPPPPPAAAAAGAAYSPAASVKVKKSIPNTEYRGERPAIAPPYTGPAQVTATSSTSPPPPATTPTTTTTAPTTPSPTPTIYRYRTVPPYRQSPTPASYQHSSDYVPPSTYKPSFVSSTSKPFSVFIGSSQRPPVSVRTRPTLRPANNFRNNKDEEVFYIFYENDDKPLEPIKTGVDLQKYIEEEIDHIKKESDFTFQDVRKTSKSRVRNQKTPVLFDVPVKIEENGEGFTPPSQIRKIFVPRDQSERIPEVFDVSVGTSFGYNKPHNRVISFPSSDGSSYNNPVSSYEAPIVADRTNNHNKPIKKVKRVKKEKLTDGDDALPFGTRLEAKAVYDIIKK